MTRDEGSIAPLIPLVILAMFMIGGLVVDGGRDLQARGDAQGYAQEAARAGAAGIDTTSARLKLDLGSGPTSAGTLVANYCATVRAANPRVTGCGLAPTPYTDDPPTRPAVCDARITQPLVVNTVVTMRIGTTLLGIVGVKALTTNGAGRARPYQGIDPLNVC